MELKGHHKLEIEVYYHNLLNYKAMLIYIEPNKSMKVKWQKFHILGSDVLADKKKYIFPPT